ncbi:MAG TPA: PrgI family protein [Candidatus Saccharimonadales bacterium]|nr:PrgI family protein [Candidatus Saccharimonadales bacterium]
MSTYKVIQDIEAEDKLLGPLTLRQFIYAAIVIVLGFICFKLLAVNFLLTLPFLPPMIFFGMLAAPFGHDQSSEVWLLAKIRFFIKPRRRIWDQSGIQQLVSITVPKKVEKHLTDGLTQSEVKSRLQALANTIDSRGWAIKNVNVNLYSQPSYLVNAGDSSDRLIEASSLPQEVPAYDVFAADDMLDEANNPTAQHLDSMINQSQQSHHQDLVSATRGDAPAASQPADYWFMNQTNSASIPTGNTAFSSGLTVAPGATSADNVQPSADDTGTAEQQLLDQIHRENARPNPAYGHMRVLDPSGKAATKTTPPKNPIAAAPNSTQPTGPVPSSTEANPAILRLASNDDLNVATIAREANKQAQKPPDDEVVISLR